MAGGIDHLVWSKEDTGAPSVLIERPSDRIMGSVRRIGSSYGVWLGENRIDHQVLAIRHDEPAARRYLLGLVGAK